MSRPATASPPGQPSPRSSSRDEVAQALADIDRLELELAVEARALPGARELVAALPAGRWGLCTSGNRILATARLAASGIEAPPVFITADDVAHGKPDPEGYALAIRRLGADPGASVVVEDAPNGVAAARAARVGTIIGVGERVRGADVDAIVTDLRDVAWDGRPAAHRARRAGAHLTKWDVAVQRAGVWCSSGDARRGWRSHPLRQGDVTA